MIADSSVWISTIAALAFVLFTLAVVGYALVRPFTHFRYRHRDGLWSHLP
jgi:uncharacterized protein involved in exopolysaccharide biosynthesis